jgi:hypothetical protein
MSREAKQNKPINQMTKYKFVTIVAPEIVRSEFTHVREDLMSSDKQLMQALWNIALRDMDAVRAEVSALKVAAVELKLASKASKETTEIVSADNVVVMLKQIKAAKPKAKAEPKPKKEPKAKKEKAVKTVMFEGREEPEVFVGLEDDDMPCMIVNGL